MILKPGGITETVVYRGGIEYHKKTTSTTTETKTYTQVMGGVEIREGSFSDDTTDPVIYTLSDHLGSATIRLDDNGTLIDKEEYYAFGDCSLRSFDKRRYRHCGKEKDNESGLYYYGARYYEAWTGRFISVDPLADKYIFQSAYVHADNNPICKIDYNGEGTGEENKTTTGNSPIHGESRTLNGCTDYWDSTINNFNGSWVGTKPLQEVIIKESKSNASKEWKSFINTISVDDFNNFIQILYNSKLANYTKPTQLNVAIYGKFSDGTVAVPNSIRDRLLNEAKNEALPALKQIWAIKKSGVNPNEFGFTWNPLERASYYSTLALTVSSKDEAIRILSTTTLDLTFSWLARYQIAWNPFRKYGVFGKDGLKIRSYKIEMMYEDSNGGGTYFSVKQNKVGGASMRIDLGIHNNKFYLHPHVRFYIFGKKIGSSKPLY